MKNKKLKAMLRNYLKIAWRNLMRTKGFSAINIFGLAIGMTVAILIGLWVWDEFSFDRKQEKYDRIVQLMQHTERNGEKSTQPWNPYPLADEIRRLYPDEFEQLAQSTRTWNLLKHGENKAPKAGIYWEEEILDILTFDLVAGSKTALKEPYSVMLSESLAKSLFGEEDPIGQPVNIDDDIEVKVTAVYKNYPDNATFNDINYILPWKLFEKQNAEWMATMEDPWRPNFCFTYGLIPENASIEAVSAKIKDVRLRNLGEKLALQKPEVFAFPMSRWHLYEKFENGVNAGGSIQYVWLFGTVGLFVLLLACINFMNLSTAQSERKSKEVGIRKAVGSEKRQLIFQFLSESLLTTFIALAISLILVLVSLNSFNEIAGKQIKIDWSNQMFWLLILGFTFTTGLLAGSYPALYLSSFNPVKVLKGTFKVGKLASLPRKALVVVQFTVSIALIIGTLVVFQQIKYAKNRPLGYNQNNLIFKGYTDVVHSSYEALKRDLLTKGFAKEVTVSSAPPMRTQSTTTGIDWDGRDKSSSFETPFIYVGLDYGKTIGWKLKAGRDFSANFDDEEKAFVINEAAAKTLGFDEPVGKILRWDGDPYEVIGVIEDMVVESPYDPSRPIFYAHSTSKQQNMIIRLSGSKSPQESIAGIKETFADYDKETPFDYEFVDEANALKFSQLERLNKLINIFAGLAILISCLGLFGLASYMTAQRSKEIGVRKVLGATVSGLWAMLSKDFLILILISLVIAAPLAAWFMNDWLAGFDYRTSIAWWTFAVTGFGAMTITLLTVSYQSIKAALMNPVKSLKTD
ncbi:ABC transporter permease [Marinilongibacter aquaticus]|uniref:ABC transporter permease n=1 Tax=Marinilongibacter aquaticus TaxID=2975157 RepID=UPI0021BD3ADB|nr:ABC transporter permease [Marinilongibacter aquaticus]UBM57295.1 ABC transporter permease [Marinilongibacter aquaticus]